MSLKLSIIVPISNFFLISLVNFGYSSNNLIILCSSSRLAFVGVRSHLLRSGLMVWQLRECFCRPIMALELLLKMQSESPQNIYTSNAIFWIMQACTSPILFLEIVFSLTTVCVWWRFILVQTIHWITVSIYFPKSEYLSRFQVMNKGYEPVRSVSPPHLAVALPPCCLPPFRFSLPWQFLLVFRWDLYAIFL